MFKRAIDNLKSKKSIDLFRFLKYTYLEFIIDLIRKKTENVITKNLIKFGCYKIENFLSEDVCKKL